VKLGLQQNNKDSLVVPIQAVVQAGNEHYVLVVDDQDRVQKRNVEVGQQTSTSAEILRGLSEKERVISVGQSDYQVGEAVQPKLELTSRDAGEDRAGERK
jgi:multidrug efflux pump subunit AcrA (membrane-fusion protein)